MGSAAAESPSPAKSAVKAEATEVTKPASEPVEATESVLESAAAAVSVGGDEAGSGGVAKHGEVGGGGGVGGGSGVGVGVGGGEVGVILGLIGTVVRVAIAGVVVVVVVVAAVVVVRKVSRKRPSPTKAVCDKRVSSHGAVFEVSYVKCVTIVVSLSLRVCPKSAVKFSLK